MALTRKTLFKENLEKYQTFVTDTNPNSTYFKISELPDVFTGGKNAFLIQGSEYLVPDTLIKIEIKDANGNVIYHEPGEGIVSSSVAGESIVTEYYEGVSKVVAVHIYPNKTTDINGNTEDGTAYGLCTITILGEVSSYIDDNGLVLPIPTEWEGQYNVKWQRQINVNPSLANTTKIRFYRRPVANITETLSPIYTIVDGVKVQSNIVSSFANVKLSQIDTFAGDVKRIKVFRTSLGDISDADLIQDILVESKELLSSYELSGSVVGNGGLFTSETLEKLWIADGITTELTSSRIDNGVKLGGDGYFKYSSSLNLSDGNIFELGIDAFYSASTASNLGIYISGSNNGEYLVSTLNGISPTKNLKDQTIQFSLPLAEPTASLYLSQSQGEWHVGNISLKLSQDSAFSPSEVDFVTSMPTVVGNETYKFNFEFYDVNNNYVPVAVTQSAVFTGGNNNIGGTLIFISASASSSAAELAAVSSSISGTMTVYSSSASGSITTLSGSVSGSITTLSGSVSSSISSLSSSVSSSNVFILSSSLSKTQQLADGRYSGSFIGDTVIYSPTIGGQQGYISDLFKVGTSPSIYLDARQNPRKIFIGGVSDSGSYNNPNTSVYMDSTGKFSLKDKLTWDGTNLSINGSITVTGGNAATQTYANTIGTNSVLSGSVSANAAQTAAQLFATSAAGRAVESGSAAATAAQTAAINQAKADASASVNLLANGNWTAGTGTFITANSISSPIIAGNGGYISTIFKVGNNGITLDGTNKKIYVGTGTYANTNTPFYFASGSTNVFSLGNKLTWDGTTLGITGNITVSGGNAATTTEVSTAQTTADNAATAAANAQTTANGKLSAGQAAADVNNNTTTISGGKIRTGLIQSNNFKGTGDGSGFATDGMSIDLTGGGISAKNFRITAGGNAFFKGDISGASGAFTGTLSGVTGTFSGTITANAGTIGQWTIDGGNLRNSTNRLVLDPNTPSITLNDTSGNAKTTIRTGNLSTISSAILSTNSSTVSLPAQSVTSAGSYGSNGRIYVDDVSLGTLTGGIYNGVYSYNYTSNPGNTVLYVGATTYAFVDATIGFDIVDSAGTVVGTFAHGAGSVSNSNFNSNAAYNGLGSSTGIFNLNIPSDGVYRKRSYYSWNISYRQTSGNPTGMTAATFTIGAIAFTKVNSFSEITDTGMQIVSSTSRYIRMETGGAFDLDAKGSWRHDSGDVSFVGTTGNLTARGQLVSTVGGNYSDSRLKEDVLNYNRGLSDIMQFNPKWFRFIKRQNDVMLSGLIAQDVEEVSPEYINEDVLGYKELNYPAVYMTMLNAIKELSNKIDDLESKISGSI